MERLIKASQANTILPDELVFRDLSKLLTKGFATCSADLVKACARIVVGLAETSDGIAKLLAFKDQQILRLVVQNFYELKEKKSDGQLEDVLDMLHIIAESSEIGHKHCLQLGSTLLSIVLEHETWNFALRLEATKFINLLIEVEVPLGVRNSQSCKDFVKQFGSCLLSAGDYEFQATIMETLFRVISVEEKESLVKTWFSCEQLQRSFLMIRNESFETDCRHFLNLFNSFDPKTQKVFSYPVISFSLGKYKLRQPQDNRVTEFWVDFNMNSFSISTFVNDDKAEEVNSQWEMICIKKDFIKDLRVNVSAENLVLILRVAEPACQLAPFCSPAPEKYIKVVAKKSSSITAGIEKLFGTVKYVGSATPESPAYPNKYSRGKASVTIEPIILCSSQESRIISQEESSRTEVNKGNSAISMEEKSKLKRSRESAYLLPEDPIEGAEEGIDFVKVNKEISGQIDLVSSARPLGICNSSTSKHIEMNSEKKGFAIKVGKEIADQKLDISNADVNMMESISTKQDEAIKSISVHPESGVIPETVDVNSPRREEKEFAEQHGRKEKNTSNDGKSIDMDSMDAEEKALDNLDVKVVADEAKKISLTKTKQKKGKSLKEGKTLDESRNMSFEHGVVDSDEAEEQKLMNTLKGVAAPLDQRSANHDKADGKGITNTLKGKSIYDEPKKGRSKKLLSIQNVVFQDSPDETYQPMPVKDPETRLQRKSMSADTVKGKLSGKKFTFVKKESDTSNFEFPEEKESKGQKGKPGSKPKKQQKQSKKKLCEDTGEDTEQEEYVEDGNVEEEEKTKGGKRGTEKEEKPGIKPKGKKGKEKAKCTTSGDPDEKQQDAAIAGGATRRSSRRAVKPVNYKECSLDNEQEENSDGSEANMKLNKSVSFVSPVEETSYFEVEPEYSGSDNIEVESPIVEPRKSNENLDNDTSLKTSVENMEVDVLIPFGEKVMDTAKEAIAESTKTVKHTTYDTTYDDEEVQKGVQNMTEKNSETKELIKDTKKASGGRKLSGDFKSLVKPFEKAVHRGWGKKVFPPSLLSAFDFVASDDENEAKCTIKKSSSTEVFNETTWTGQRNKKEKIKMEYKVKKSFKQKNKQVNEENDQSSSQETMFSSQDSSDLNSDVNRGKIMNEASEKKNKVQRNESQVEKMFSDISDGGHSPEFLGKEKKAKRFYGKVSKCSHTSVSYKHGSHVDEKQAKKKKKKYVKRKKLCELIGMSAQFSSSQDSQDSPVRKPNKKKRVVRKQVIPSIDYCVAESSQEYESTKSKPPRKSEKVNKSIDSYFSPVQSAAIEKTGGQEQCVTEHKADENTKKSKKDKSKKSGIIRKSDDCSMDIDEEMFGADNQEHVDHEGSPKTIAEHLHTEKISASVDALQSESSQEILAKKDSALEEKESTNEKQLKPLNGDSDISTSKKVGSVVLKKGDKKKNTKESGDESEIPNNSEYSKDLVSRAETLVSCMFVNDNSEKVKYDKDGDVVMDVISKDVDMSNDDLDAEVAKQNRVKERLSSEKSSHKKQSKTLQNKVLSKVKDKKVEYSFTPVEDSGDSSTSVDGSQEPPIFFETPSTSVMNIDGKKDTRRSLEKTLESIEAVCNTNRTRRKLLKTPVILLNDIKDSLESEKHKVTKKKQTRKSTRLSKEETVVNQENLKLQQSVSERQVVKHSVSKPDNSKEFKNFNDFCQNMLTDSVTKSEVVHISSGESTKDVGDGDTSLTCTNKTKTYPLRSKKVVTCEEESLPSSNPEVTGTQYTDTQVSIEYIDGDEGQVSKVTDSSDDDNFTLSQFSYKENEEVTLSLLSSGNNEMLSSLGSQHIAKEEKEIQPIISSFGNNFSKTLDKKKEVFERFTQRVTKLAASKMQATWNAQHNCRKSVDTSFLNDCTNELEEWHSACDEKEKKMLAILDTLKETLKESSRHEKSNLKKLKQMNHSHFEEKEKMYVEEKQQQFAAQDELRQEIRQARNDMMQQSKSLELCNMRTALKSMLNTV